MRSSITLRFGALICASALTLSLGAAPSSASESSHIEGSTSSAPQKHRDGRIATGADVQGDKSTSRAKSSSSAAAVAAVNVKKIKAYYAELYEPEVNYIDVELTLSTWTDVDSIDLNLKVDGKNKGSFPVYYDESEDIFYIEVPGNIGLGKSIFTGSTVHYTEESARVSTTDATDSNKFNVRRGVIALEDEEGYIAEYGGYGKQKYFEVYGLFIYSPAAEDFVPLKTIKLQYKKGSKWKTKKTMKLDEGYGFYEWKTSSKYRYRLYYASTTTFEGFYTGATDKF